MEPNNILILADESANWKIAGLRQLERLAFDINDFAEAQRVGKIDIFVFWKPTIPAAERWLPEDPRLGNCDLHVTAPAEGARALSTCLILQRRTLADFIPVAPEMASGETWEKLSRAFVETCRNAEPSLIASGWRCVAAPNEIPAAERWFLRGSGKPQDGFVARFLNRPISRAISRALLRTSLTPGAWTASIFGLPIIGFILLLRGDYFGFVSGAAFFQLFSIVDGCDGEIARAKYLESERGRRLDTLGDIAGNILFALGLGLGLQRFNGFFYAVEGIVCAFLIAANESLLAFLETRRAVVPGVLGDALYSRHRAMIERAGLFALGQKPLWWLFQLTKRDMAILFFLLLAIIGRPQWALHLWTAVSTVSVTLAISARWRARG